MSAIPRGPIAGGADQGAERSQAGPAGRLTGFAGASSRVIRVGLCALLREYPEGLEHERLVEMAGLPRGVASREIEWLTAHGAFCLRGGRLLLAPGPHDPAPLGANDPRVPPTSLGPATARPGSHVGLGRVEVGPRAEAPSRQRPRRISAGPEDWEQLRLPGMDPT